MLSEVGDPLSSYTRSTPWNPVRTFPTLSVLLRLITSGPLSGHGPTDGGRETGRRRVGPSVHRSPEIQVGEGPSEVRSGGCHDDSDTSSPHTGTSGSVLLNPSLCPSWGKSLPRGSLGSFRSIPLDERRFYLLPWGEWSSDPGTLTGTQVAGTHPPLFPHSAQEVLCHSVRRDETIFVQRRRN